MAASTHCTPALWSKNTLHVIYKSPKTNKDATGTTVAFFPYGNSVKESILTDSRRTQILNEWRWEGRRVDYGNKCKKACLTNCLLQMVIWLYFIKIMEYREMLTTTIWKSEICHLSSTVAAFSSILITQAYIMPKYIHHTNRKPSLEVVLTNIISGPY